MAWSMLVDVGRKVAGPGAKVAHELVAVLEVVV